MRKKKFIYAALALMTLGFTSCQQEDDFTAQGGNDEIRVSFTTDAIQTRVNTLDTGDVWEVGDQVKIEKTVGSTTEYYTYTAASVAENGYTTWTPDKKLYWDGDEEHILAAFYPVAEQSEYSIFNLPHDQSTEEKLKSADCMNAVWIGKPTTDAIHFQMKHRLSMVTIKYEFASEFTDATIISPRVKAIAPIVWFNVDGGEMMEPIGNFITDIHAYTIDNKTIQAIVIPCTYPQGQLFMEMEISDNYETLKVNMPEAKTLKEGTHYIFDLKIGKNKVELTPTGTNQDFPGGWNNDSEENLN